MTGEAQEKPGDSRSPASPGKQLVALMFTDLVGSVALQQRLGTEAYMRCIKFHDDLVHECLALVPDAQVISETGDGFLARFGDPSAAVNTALRLQYRLNSESADGELLAVRIGLHLGVVTEMEEQNLGFRRAVGMPINLTARVMDLGEGGQILMTRAVQEDARNFVRAHPTIGECNVTEPLEWRAHGLYEFKGNPEPLEIFEVGVAGIAPLSAPEGGAKARRLQEIGSPTPSDGSAIVAEPVDAEDDPFSVESVHDSDVVIVHAPVDDQPLTPGHPGWISQFQRNLEIRLEQLSGEPVKVWRDTGPDSAERSEEIMAALPGVKSMVSIVSPPFVKSSTCLREMEAFWVTDRASASASDPPRLLKAVKTPVPSEELPARLAQLPEFRFYETDPDTGRIREFDPSIEECARRLYFDRVSDVAYEVCEVLKKHRLPSDLEQKRGGTGQHAGEGKTVYLAETTSDLQPERDRLRRELVERGYRVVPTKPLPLTRSEFEASVQELLSGADLSVHLVGTRYGLIPEDAERSVVDLQNLLAAEMCREDVRHSLQRLIWMPREVQPRDDRQDSFIKSLVEDPDSHRGGEVIRDTLANLKLHLLDLLQPKAPQDTAAGTATTGVTLPPSVYLVCDPRDEEAVEPLEDYLFDSGFEVLTPQFEGNIDEITRRHREHLTRCDAVLIYYGAASRAWVETNLQDVLRAPGYGREIPVHAQLVYVAPPEDRRKSRYRTHLAEVVRQDGEELNTAVLAGFLEALKETSSSKKGAPTHG